VLSSHPRLFLTQANLPEIRQKLADPVYSGDMRTLKKKADSGNAIANAFLYQLEGDVNRGIAAKNYLLAGSYRDVPSLERSADWVEPVLIFDWVYPLLSEGEKTQVFTLLKANFGYDHRTASPPTHSRYWNDTWARHPHLHYPILALAIAGDGIDDVWAQEVLDLVYTENPLVMGPYGPQRGSGFLDMLASISLDDGGGEQIGSDLAFGSGYYMMFLHAFMPMGAWETATGQAMWRRSPFFQKLPSYWAYDRHKRPAYLGNETPELLTGIYRDIDPDAAALARWEVDKWGRGRYLLVYRLILGDLRVVPKSPEQLGLPTAKYIRGADLFVSSRDWNENAVTVKAYSRYLDTNRYEPGSGVFSIQHGSDPLAVPAEPSKQYLFPGFYSGLWIYDANSINGEKFQGSTYWGLGPSRANDSYTAVSNPGYFPGGPDKMIINNIYRGISTEYSQLFKDLDVRKSRQTLVHIMDTNRDFVVVYNYTDVPASLKRAWSMRLAVPPEIQGNGYSIPGMHTTVIAPLAHTITWVGGVGDEFRSPPPEKTWYGNNRAGNTPGYSSDPGKAKANGIGNLFVQPDGTPPEQLEFLVVMDIGEGSPVSVTRVSDREVHFGNWEVSFTPDGDFNVVNTGPLPLDTTPPSPPSILNVQ